MLQKSYYLSDTVKHQVQPLINTIPDSCKMTTYNNKTEQKRHPIMQEVDLYAN